ncbi:MAG TPA: hypothetical protein VMZ53_07680 [Kofleriaceae bacterium]|nr:hypothetical protein [Kofleriaceae bacterium]
MARALVILVLLAFTAVAYADEPVGPQAIEEYIDRGKKLFEEQEYAGAIQALAPVTRDVRATRAQRLRALEIIALAQFIRNDKGAARATFERILDIDPGYQLRDTSGSPAMRAFFDDLKKQLIPGFDPKAGADLEHAAPTAGSAGTPVEVEVRVTRGNVFDLVLATRRRGELTYALTPLAPRGENRWRAKITPPPSAKPYVLEYYVEARDAGGGPIARIANPNQPLEIALTAGGESAITPGRRAWYQHWYVYAGGAALAAGIGGVVVATTRGPDSGSLPPHTITVTP